MSSSKIAKRGIAFLAAALVALAATGALAQHTLAVWNSSGANNAQGSYAPNEVGAGVEVGNLVVGPGLKAGAGQTANVFGAYDYAATSYDDAKGKDDYWEFSVFPSNAIMTLRELSCGFGGPKTGPQSATWAWSTNRTTWNVIGDLDIARTDTKYFTFTYDLSSLPSVEGTIWFRLYAWGGGTASTACGSFGRDANVLSISGSLASLSAPPEISFNPAVPEVGVSNTIAVTATLLPRTGSGIKSETFSPAPAGTFSVSGGKLTFKPIADDFGSSFTYSVTATNAYGSTTNSVVVKVVDYQVPGSVTLSFDTQTQTSWSGKHTIEEPSGSSLKWELSGITVRQDEEGVDKVYGGVGRALRFSNSGTSTLTSTNPILNFHTKTQGVSKVTWYVGVSGELQEGVGAPTMSLLVSPDLEHWITVDEFTASDYAADGSLVRRVSRVGLAGPAYLRFSVIGNGVNVNLDQVIIEPYDALSNVEKYLLQYNVTPGDDLTGMRDDYDGDGRINLQESSQKKNPYLKD